MAKTWQLQEAKARFSKLVEEALKGEPQLVTRRGRKAVVVLDWETRPLASPPRPHTPPQR